MNYYFEYEKRLKLVCINKNFCLQSLGKIGAGRKEDIWLVRNNYIHGRKTVCFSAGCHGEEYAGPLAILDFLKKVEIAKLGVNIFIFPIINPSGFNSHTRHNYLGQQLNDLSKNKRLAREVDLIYSFLKKYKINFFHAIHEDVDKKRFYMYIFESKKEKIYRDILRLSRRYFKTNTNTRIATDFAKNGLIINAHDNSFEDRLFLDGTDYSCCTETPGRESTKQRVKLNLEIMEKIIDFMQNN